MKESVILSIYGDNEVGQHIRPTNIPGPQEPNREITYVLGNNGTSSYMHIRKEDN